MGDSSDFIKLNETSEIFSELRESLTDFPDFREFLKLFSLFLSRIRSRVGVAASKKTEKVRKVAKSPPLGFEIMSRASTELLVLLYFEYRYLNVNRFEFRFESIFGVILFLYFLFGDMKNPLHKPQASRLSLIAHRPSHESKQNVRSCKTLWLEQS